MIMKSLALPHNCLQAVKLLQSLAASLALLLAAPVSEYTLLFFMVQCSFIIQVYISIIL